MKSAKLTTICHTIEETYDIYSKGCKEGPSKVTKIMNFMRLRKLKFTLIHQPIHEIPVYEM